MKYRALFVLLLCASGAAHASENAWLTLSPMEIERLGIALGTPQPASAVELATGPAEVVIPPAQQAVVSAPAGGVLTRLLVAEGEAVRAGQALAEIRSAELLAIQRDYLDALSAERLAASQLERDLGLRSDGIIADKRLQETQAAAHAAALAADQSRQQLMLAGYSTADLKQLATEQQLSATIVVRAPFDGVAVELLANLGARVETLDPVFRVADLNTLWLEIHVPQERASRMRPQQQFAAVVVDGHTIEASLAHVGQVVDTGSQTVMTRAVADNSDGRLRAGQVLPARIFSRSSAETGTVVTIPATSVVRDSGQEYVFVRVGEGFAVRQITLIAEDAESAYVGSGLEPQSEIAFAGVAVLKSIWFENRSLEETP